MNLSASNGAQIFVLQIKKTLKKFLRSWSTQTTRTSSHRRRSLSSAFTKVPQLSRDATCNSRALLHTSGLGARLELRCWSPFFSHPNCVSVYTILREQYSDRKTEWNIKKGKRIQEIYKTCNPTEIVNTRENIWWVSRAVICARALCITNWNLYAV